MTDRVRIRFEPIGADIVEMAIEVTRPLTLADQVQLATEAIKAAARALGADMGAIRIGHEDRHVEAVIEAAREIERGCDCEYDHRCGRCSRVVALQAALKALDEARR